jgi:hypothetical protein
MEPVVPSSTNKIQALKNIANNLPVADQTLQNQKDATAAIQLKQAVAQSPTSGPKTAQQLGGAAQAVRGQAAVQQQQQKAQTVQNIGQLGQQAQQLQDTVAVSSEQRKLSKEQRVLTNQLSKLSLDLKTDLLDKQLTFEKDESGRAFMNTRQLADWARLNAENQVEFNKYQQMANQASQRKLLMLETAQKKLQQELAQRQSRTQTKLDQEQNLKLAQMQRAMQEKIANERNKAGQMAGIFTAVGTIAGAAIVGSATLGTGTMAGAAVGASIGGSLGGVAATQVK